MKLTKMGDGLLPPYLSVDFDPSVSRRQLHFVQAISSHLTPV